MGPLKYEQAHSVISRSIILLQHNDRACLPSKPNNRYIFDSRDHSRGRAKLGVARAAVEARPLAQRHLMSVDGTVNAMPSSRERTKRSFLSLLWIKTVRPEATGRPVIFVASAPPPPRRNCSAICHTANPEGR